jgi:hypothetical protein
MVGTTPAPAALAHWLLTHEAGTNPTPVAAAAERVHARLREGLAVFLGQSGFDSLWARALHLAQGTQFGAAQGDGGPGSRAPALGAPVSERDAAETQDVPLATLASFIALLFTFVGAALGVRLIHHVWPELLLGEADMQTGDDTP